jgi:hypothetical protein
MTLTVVWSSKTYVGQKQSLASDRSRVGYPDGDKPRCDGNISMRFWIAILLTFLSSLTWAAEPQILMAVYKYDAWLRVEPVMMLYDDGALLYEPSPRSSDWVRRTIADPAGWLSERMSSSLGGEKRHYNVSSSIHAVTTVIWTRDAKLSVRGDWRSEPEIVPPESVRPEITRQGSTRREVLAFGAASLPMSVRHMLEELQQERSQPGEPWTWQQIELQLSPVDDAKGDFAAWPGDWPANLAFAARRCGADELYVMRLPVSMTVPLRELLAAARQRQIVLINGRKMQVAAHAVLPEESQWFPACTFHFLPL